MKVADFVMNRANIDYFLPSVQREFVWFKNPKEQKVERLFDSLLQGYPIGNLLIWKFNKKKEDDKLPFEVYEFVKTWDKDNPHNKEAGHNGLIMIQLILDGQQRLTSLLIGLRGKRIYNKKREEKLYINLFSNIENDKDNIDGLKYELKFLDDSDKDQENNEKENTFWFEVGKVLDYRDKTAEEFKEAFTKTINDKSTGNSELVKKGMNTLGRIHQVFCDNDNLIESTVDNKNEEQVLDIFVRINQGGTPLEKADMLLSYMEADKSFFKPKHARKEVLGFVDQLNIVEVDKPNYKLDQDFVLKAALVLTDLDIQYKLKNFTKENLQKISDEWAEIKKYLILTTRLLGRYKFSKKNIVSKNALIPISYYLMHNKIDDSIIYSTDKKDIELMRNIVKWLAIASLEGLFGGASDTTLGQTRKQIKEDKRLEDTLGYILKRDDIEEIVGKARYNRPLTRLILMLVIDQKYWEFAEDHLFAQKHFRIDKLKKMGLDKKGIDEFTYHEDSIGNLQLLDPKINIKKSAEEFIEWGDKQNEEYYSSFLIPKIEDYGFSNFIEFVNKREEMIVEKLCSILIQS